MATIAKLDKKFNIIKTVSITGTISGLEHLDGNNFIVSRFISGTNSAVQTIYIDWKAGAIRQVNTIVSTATATTTYRGVSADEKYYYYFIKTATPLIVLRKVDRNGKIVDPVFNSATSSFWGVTRKEMGNRMIISEQVGGSLVPNITMIDKANHLLSRLSLGAGEIPTDLTFDGKYIYCCDSGTDKVTQYDLKFKIIRVSSAMSFNAGAVTTDGKYLYVAG